MFPAALKEAYSSVRNFFLHSGILIIQENECKCEEKVKTMKNSTELAWLNVPSLALLYLADLTNIC